MTKTEVAAIEAAGVALQVATGAMQPADGAKALFGLAVDMIPVEELKGFLSERERIFIDLENDVLEQIKLQGKEP